MLPSASAAKPKLPMGTWSGKQLAQFYESIIDHRLYPAFYLLGNTGLRRGEALGLRWSNADLDTGRLSIVETLVVIRNRVHESQPKTLRGVRAVAIDSKTATVLQEWLTVQKSESLKWGSAWKNTDRVFTKEDGSDLHPERISELFGRLINRAGLPKIRLHDLRHTHASLALEAGVHPKVVSERLGHGGVSITLDLYSHVIPAMQEDAAERVAELVADASRR